ncbi:hypothetical protein [Ralstonia mojiangensis]|uniref:hypothetical protein n=1 Tax=Ralstonia mojiangensis TaxID=2953895 RepID=UPI00209089D9|nr:hypothetical protein [Ralstonia mojiangensis]MCO5410431.1 hypothetical protein [Ralstonia mojiangensis]
MPKFVVRVTIHDGREQDYQRLHEALEAIGCLRRVMSGDGRWYQLPDATYVYKPSTPANAESVRDRVAPIVKLTVPRTTAPEVFVAEYSSSAWSGLTVVK